MPQPPSPSTAARFLAETLASYGVTHVFYVDAILRKTMVELEALGVRRVVTHSEKAAAYMADGYARIARRAGVCLAQSVGAANLAAALQDAWLGHSPVIALTGKKPPAFQHRHAYQEIDHTPLFAAVTKFNADVTTPAQLPQLLQQAFRAALSATPGPVHLDLLGHNGRALEAATGEFGPAVAERTVAFPLRRLRPDPDEVTQAVSAIASAKRPVIVAGGGVTLGSAAQSELAALAEKLSIPVATSVNGKGAILDAHPLSVGVVGSYSARCANQVVAEADLVIFVGSGTGDQTTHDWRLPRPGAAVVQIDLDPAEIGRNYPGAVGVVGDAKAALTMLHEACQPAPADPGWLPRVHELVTAWRQEIEPLRCSAAIPIRPERLCKELSDALPADAVLVSDTGYAAIWTATMVQLRQPGQTYLRAAGSLGWAFPAALGVKCAAPERPVLCFSGDGGFWYHLAELETARRHGIATVTVVNNNGGFAQGIDDIHAQYGDRPGRPEELYRFAPVDFARLATDIGCLGLRVEHPADLAPALRQALAANRPAVIDVVTDLSHRAPAPWTPN